MPVITCWALWHRSMAPRERSQQFCGASSPTDGQNQGGCGEFHKRKPHECPRGALGCHLVSMDSFAKHILHGKQAENIKFAPCRQKALQIHICKAFSRQHPGEAGAVRAVIAVLGWTELLSSKDTRRLYSEYFAGHGERSQPWIKIRAITAESDLAERGAKHKDKCPRLFVSVREFIKEISVSDRLGILPHIAL